MNEEVDTISLDDLEAAAALYDKLVAGTHYKLEDAANNESQLKLLSTIWKRKQDNLQLERDIIELCKKLGINSRKHFDKLMRERDREIEEASCEP